MRLAGAGTRSVVLSCNSRGHLGVGLGLTRNLSRLDIYRRVLKPQVERKQEVPALQPISSVYPLMPFSDSLTVLTASSTY